MNRDELRAGCADLLKALRQNHKLSKAKMAQLMYVDDHTWNKYETGQSSPSVPDFLNVFNVLGEDALSSVLGMIYPDIYTNVDYNEDADDLRDVAVHFLEHVAPDRTVRQFCYSLIGKSGSNYVPRMDQMCMIEHLPMDYKVIVARMIMELYELAEAENRLVGMDNVLPDVDLLKVAIDKGEDAVKKGRTSYTTIL